MDYITIEHEPGLTALPDAPQWKRWVNFLTIQERVVYLWLRWLSTQRGFAGRMTLKQMARDVGDRDHGWKWDSKGSMPQSQMMNALNGLADKGLLELSDFETD